jgi:HAD superfamily hydrolase (TIGR01549 family)
MPLSLNTTTLFLDLGGVLFYDEYVELYFYYQVFMLSQHLKPDLTIESYFNAREELFPIHQKIWVHRWLDREFFPTKTAEILTLAWNSTKKNFSQLFKPYPHVASILQKLSKQYNLYIVANQPEEALLVLKDLKLSPYFSDVFLDALVGYSKPDPRLFLKALEEANLSFQEVVHIGDRLDNDILPAQSVGIRAIQLLLPVEYVALPLIPEEFSKRLYTSLKKQWTRGYLQQDNCVKASDDYSVNSYQGLLQLFL